MYPFRMASRAFIPFASFDGFPLKVVVAQAQSTSSKVDDDNPFLTGKDDGNNVDIIPFLGPRQSPLSDP